MVLISIYKLWVFNISYVVSFRMRDIVIEVLYVSKNVKLSLYLKMNDINYIN